MSDTTVYPHARKQVALTVQPNDIGMFEVLVSQSPDDPFATATILGMGKTRDAAVADAVNTVEWLHDCLQGPPPERDVIPAGL